MSLEDKSLPELETIKAKLLQNIQRNPEHSNLDRVELEDVEGWIHLRQAEQQKKGAGFEDIDFEPDK
jgi:hypothetical protein